MAPHNGLGVDIEAVIAAVGQVRHQAQRQRTQTAADVEHTVVRLKSARAQLLRQLGGEAALTLGEDTVEAKPGTWVHMPTGLRHSIQATTPVVMLLLLMKEPRP